MNRNALYKAIAILIFILLLNGLWYNYVRSENTIYSWDFDNYWGKCWRFLHYFETDPVLFARAFVHSVRGEDYTAEPILPTVLVLSLGEKLHLFSYSRLSYILVNGNLYLVPSLLLLVWLVSALRRNDFTVSLSGIPAAAWLAGALMALLTPGLWLPLLRGYPDGGGLIFCFLITALFVRWRQQRRGGLDDLLSWLAIVVLLVGLVFFRRWYLYWVIWFWIAAGSVCLWGAYEQWRHGSRGWEILQNLAELTGAGILFGILLLAVSPRFVQLLFTYNYADRYSVFNWSKSIGEYFLNTFSSPGVVGILLFLGGVIYGFFNPDLRELAVFQVVQLCGLVVHFGRTSDFDLHNVYLLLAIMLPLATLFVAELVRRFRWIPIACLVPIGLLGTTLSFTSAMRASRHVLLEDGDIRPRPGDFGSPMQRAHQILRYLTGAVRGAPLRRGDIAEWRRLGTVMDEILRSRGRGMIYVLASSTTINSSAFLSLGRSLNEKLLTPNFVWYSNDADKRDGFPAKLLRAKYVIVAYPIQTEYDPAEQQVIVAPAHEFLEGSGIAAAFEKLPVQFILDGGVRVYIYERIREISSQEVGQLSDELRKAHPDRPYIYTPPAEIK